MQVATLFRESATLLGASMEAGELHGLKMSVFSEGSMKQDAANDDGYETSLDHLELRAHTQGDQGKMSQGMMDQHLQATPPQMQQQMQHVHHAHQHHGSVAAEQHRLHVRHHQESQRLNSLEHQQQQQHLDNRLSPSDALESRLQPHENQLGHRLAERQSDHEGRLGLGEGRMDRLNSLQDGRLSAGSDAQTGHLSAIENRLSEHDSQVNSIDNPLNSLSSRIQSHESHISNHDSRILNHENQMNSVGNQIVGHENHISAIENRLGHDSHLSDSDSQMVNRETRLGAAESRMSGHENGLGSHENHMSNITGRLGRDGHLSGLENGIGGHESHMGPGMDGRMSHESHMNNLDKRLAAHENHLNSIENRMSTRENHMNGLDTRMGSLDSRMVAHDNHIMGNRDNHMNSLVTHENHINGVDGRLGVREAPFGHHDGRLPHVHMNSIDARDGMMNAHANHLGPHLGHMGPHPHMQGLHHSHHPHPHHMHHPHHGHPHPHMKCDSMEDPYSFVDDEPSPLAVATHPNMQPRPSPLVLQPIPKKRGRKKKIKLEDGMDTAELIKKENGSVKPVKERKKHDRFNGMPEEEVVKRTLPDHLTTNLDIVIIGINPGLFAAYKGHHYAGPGNHFWKCLYLSGLTPEPMTADDDYKLLSVGIGFTNMVARATKGSADLTRKEIKEGSQILLEKLQKFKPKIAVFNGKLIYEVFSGNKDFHFGRQPDFVDGTNTYMWVMPSSSARCAQLPRAADKVPFYAALKKFRDYLNGLIADIDETEIVFNDQKLKTFYESDVKVEHKDEQGNYYPYSRIPGNELTDLSNAVVKKEPFDPNRPEKKKRGRPKKIRVEGAEPPPPKERIKKEKILSDGDAPKKKRGRPKKIKTEDGTILAPQNVTIQNGGLSVSEHTSSSNPASTCFSPPIQSPSGFCQGFSPAYANQTQGAVPPSFNPRPPSPAYHPSPHHPSPMPTQYSQSPPPTSQSQSQPFTHSDLSSEISAAISSEHLGSPPPTSPSLGPPDFEPPTSMPEDTAASMSVKEEPEQECRFSSPAPSESAYQYRGFADSDMEHKPQAPQFQRQSSPEFAAKRQNQDVASKSLSGLESLVDQIPSIAEGSTGTTSASGNGEGFESQPSGQYEDYLGYPGYSGASSVTAPQPSYPHYTSSTNYSAPGYIPPSQSNFSVSSLANSASHGHEGQVPSSFSVSSLASNYTPGGYPNLMGAPHLVVPQPGLFPTGMNMTPNYQYPGQYPTSAASFPYSPHALHVPSPNYPPYGPYSNSSSYPQPYLANHVLDRIKQERMDIGFGGF